MHRIFQVIRDDRGQDLMEYGLLASLLAIAAVLTIRAIAPLVNGLFVLVQSQLPT